MEQKSSWEAENCLAAQEIPCFLWNQKVHYCVHKSPPLFLILIHSRPSHIPAISLRSSFGLSFHLCLFFQVVCFHQIFQPECLLISDLPMCTTCHAKSLKSHWRQKFRSEDLNVCTFHMYSNLIFTKIPRKSPFNDIMLHYHLLQIYGSFAEEPKSESREVKTEKPDTPRNMKPPPEKKPRLA
jgi:hypothetical protein